MFEMDTRLCWSVRPSCLVPCYAGTSCRDKSFTKSKHNPRHAGMYSCRADPNTALQIFAIGFYMHRSTNVTIAIRKHINYGWYKNYVIFLNKYLLP